MSPLAAASIVLAPYAALIGCIVVILRLLDDVRTWRESASDLRDCYHFEKERTAFLKKRLEEEMRRQKEGPYR